MGIGQRLAHRTLPLRVRRSSPEMSRTRSCGIVAPIGAPGGPSVGS
jgi:hypothetical protein